MQHFIEDAEGARTLQHARSLMSWHNAAAVGYQNKAC